MSYLLFADGSGGVDAPEWLKTAALVLSMLLIPASSVFAGLYFRLREARRAERKEEVELTGEEREQARKDKSEDERALDRQRDKLWKRIEQIEANCRKENEELQDWVTALIRHIMTERALVGRWMGRVTGWIDYAAAEAKRAGMDLRPFTEPPPDMPDLPRRPELPKEGRDE